MIKYSQHSYTTHTELHPDRVPVGSVIWLHGLGADGNDFVPIVDELGLPKTLPLRFIFPNAPMQAVTINQGYHMRAWFDVYSLTSEHPIDRDGIANSAKLLAHYIEQEQQHQVPPEKIVLVGFSQGAAIALTTGLRYPQKLAGMMALSGYLPDADAVFQQAASANKTTPIFIAHGTDDPILPYSVGEKTAHLLQQHAYPVSWHSYPMPHTVCEKEISDINRWLQQALSNT